MNSTTNRTATPTVHQTANRPGPDIGSLIAGILFTGLGVAFVLEASGQWSFELSDFRYVGPLVLIVLGITTLVGASMAHRIPNGKEPST